MRVHTLIGRLALAAGAWVALAGLAEAQNKGRGKGGGGGGGGGRPPAARSAPAQRSAPQRAPAARSAPAQRAPVVRQAPQQQRAPAAREAQQRRDPVARQAPQQQRAPAVRDRDVDRGARDLNARNRDRNWDGDRNRDGDRWNGNRNWNGRNWDDDWDDDDDDFWEYLAYGAAARFLGVPFGNYGFYPYYGGYGGYPYYGSGYGGYRYPGYYRGYYSGDDGYYNEPYYSEPYYSTAPAQPAGDVAMMRVIVPDPDARVWVQGRETSSRGTERTYNSPPLESGYEYTYNIRAEWQENGQTMAAERRVSVNPGDRLTVDFTRGPAEAITE